MFVLVFVLVFVHIYVANSKNVTGSSQMGLHKAASVAGEVRKTQNSRVFDTGQT